MTALSQVIQYYAEAVVRSSANTLGEILREWAFIGKGYGCYSNFDVRPEFKQVKLTEREFQMLMGRPSGPPEEDGWGWDDADVFAQATWYKHPNGIEMGYYWDGDGTLAFFVPELVGEDCSGVLTNGDCKTDNEWEWSE